MELGLQSNIPLLRKAQTRRKGQYKAELTLSPRLHVKPLITTIRAIVLSTLKQCNSKTIRNHVLCQVKYNEQRNINMKKYKQLTPNKVLMHFKFGNATVDSDVAFVSN